MFFYSLKIFIEYIRICNKGLLLEIYEDCLLKFIFFNLIILRFLLFFFIFHRKRIYLSYCSIITGMIIMNLNSLSSVSSNSKFCNYSFVLIRAFILISILFILPGCSEKKTESEYPIIDVLGSVEKYQRVYCSDYFSSIELIPLETREDCLLPGVNSPKIILKDSFIFMRSIDAVYSFSTSGKFLNQIGRKGQGPGEYVLTSRYFLSTDRSIIYVEDVRKILEYDFYGNHINSIQKPLVGNKTPHNFSYVGDGVFISSIDNDGKNKYKYYLVNQNREPVDSFPNYVFFNRK